ncbi:EAL domain-containing protein [Vibrio maritimus]|uniref:EAL domain-containing protein n=1 Tax=Vibrio maritimus TaxID=990268 RepID=UPI001F3C3EED|nr:EAL domain-containing protein [Vibrio maritimus]
MNILIVEDDRIQAYRLKMDLYELGQVNITIAHSCNEALLAFKKLDFDLVFCDISLPDKDGIYFIEQISFKARKVHLVLLSLAENRVLSLIEKVAHVLDFKKTSRIDKPYKLSQLKTLLLDSSGIRKTSINNQTNYYFSESEVISAISRNEVDVHFQPQVDIATGTTKSVEALARWQHNDFGLLSAGAFIDSLTSDQALFLLFENTVKKSIEGIVSLSDVISLSVNVTHRDIQSVDFYNLIVTHCTDSQFPYERLTLELTESHMHLVSKQALVTLARLKLLGVRLSIDDLGSGYSSLIKLTQIPFDEIKIDKSFINGVCHDFQKTAIVQLLVNLAKQLNLTCIAEGVEDKETLEFTKTLGIDLSQGYFTGEPLSHVELKKRLSRETQSLHKVGNIDCLIIDDHTIVTAALKQAIKQCNFIRSVSSCVSINQAITKLSSHKYNLLLVDIKLGNESGFTIIEHLDSINYKGSYVFMSGGTNPTYPFLSREKGALGYLDKAMEVNEFIQELYRIVSREDTSSSMQAYTSSPISQLSKREFEVLDLLVQGMSNKTIANRLNLSEKTVSTYKSRLLEKLNCKSIIDVSRDYFM